MSRLYRLCHAAARHLPPGKFDDQWRRVEHFATRGFSCSASPIAEPFMIARQG